MNVLREGTAHHVDINSARDHTQRMRFHRLEQVGIKVA